MLHYKFRGRTLLAAERILGSTDLGNTSTQPPQVDNGFPQCPPPHPAVDENENENENENEKDNENENEKDNENENETHLESFNFEGGLLMISIPMCPV